MDNYNMYGQFPNDNEIKPEKKNLGGFLPGVISGLLGCMVLILVGVFAYSSITGEYIILGKHGINSASQNKILDKKTTKKIDELVQYMDLYYFEDYKTEDIQKSVLSSVLEGLGDPYSVYYTKEDYEDLQVKTTGTYYGIGAGLKQDPDTMEVTITKIYEGTPSQEAGLLEGDMILYVDETDSTSIELTALVQQIRGEEGTSVHLKVYRPSTNENLEFDVERRNVELPSVEGEMLEGDMGYIQISEFQTNTAEQFKTILENMLSNGMKGLIVDVRSNPGGLLSSVVDILDQLLPEGVVVYTQDKYGNRQDYTSEASCVDFPITVLINENSASASEIFAGAIKDYEYGTLVGKKSFGKGIVQTIFPLEDGDAVKITTAKYYTPNGNYIHGVGIEPDVDIDYEYTGDKNKDYEKKYDNQLQKAIEVLGDKIKK